MRANIHDAIVEAQGGPAYTGQAGQTRKRAIHLAGTGGAVYAREVYRTVNVRTHPELKSVALSGELHVLSDVGALALPWVYHDPDELKFVLVLPESLRHQEFSEWAALMGEVAADTSVMVPRYVRDAGVVVGYHELQRYAAEPLQLDDSELTDAEDEVGGAPQVGAFSVRRAELRVQQARLSRMAELLAQRERELARREAELRAEATRLGQRERAFAVKLMELQHEAQIVPSLSAEGEWQEVASALELPPALPERERASTPPPHRLHSVPPPLRLSPRRRTQPPPLRPRSMTSGYGWTAAPSGEDPPPLPRAGYQEARPEVPPPAEFRHTLYGGMVSRLVDDELWLFAAMDALSYATLGRSPELLLQCVTPGGYPVLVLSIIGVRADGHVGARLVLDGLSGEAVAALSTLESAYRARVAVFVSGRYQETLTLSALREGVAKAARELVQRYEADPARAKDALAEVLAAPPPLDSEDLPFGPARRPLSSTAGALAAAEQLESWLSAERLRLATLVYSVPGHVIAASARRVLRAAMSYGVALSDRLVQAAIDYDVVASPRALLEHQLQAFRDRIVRGDNDMDERATRRNWERLLKQAAGLALPVDAELRSFATAAVGDGEQEETVTALTLEDCSDDELEKKLAEPAARVTAFQLLCARQQTAAMPALCAVLDTMAPGEVARCAPHLLRFGERAADSLLLCFRSRNASVRHASALIVGKLQLGQHVEPLLRRIDEESTPAWREMARALGEFAHIALPETTEFIPDAERPERFVVVLGHLANHGCARDVESLENNTNPTLAGLARRAMAGRGKLEWEDLAVREQRSLAENSPTARFSQAFYAEAAKVDI